MKTFLTILYSLVALSLTAQLVTVSEPVSLRNDQAYEIIGKMKDRFLLFRDRANNDFEIQAFNENLQLTWNKELEFERKKTEVIGIVADDDHFNVIYGYKKKGKYLVKANKYDAGANLIDSSLVYNYDSRFYPPKVNLVYSEDKSKALLYSIERQTKIEVMCFDLKSMELLWSNEFEPDGMVYHVDYEQPLISNDGQFFYVLGKDNRRSTKNKHLYEVFEVNQGTSHKKVPSFTISMEDMMTFDVRFEFDNLNNNIVAGGLYSEKNRGRGTGYFYMNIPVNNPDDHILVFEAFSDKFVSDFLGKTIKENKGIPETIVQEIVLRRDGGIIILAEKSKLLERQMLSANRSAYADEGRGGYIVDYHFEDVMAISIHPDGSEHWETILPKKQYSQDDDAIYSSFFFSENA